MESNYASIQDQTNNYLYANKYSNGSGYGNETSLAEFEAETGIDLSDFEFKVSNPNSDTVAPNAQVITEPSQLSDEVLNGNNENMTLTYKINAFDGNDNDPTGNNGSGFQSLHIGIKEINSNTYRHINFNDWDKNGSIGGGSVDMKWSANGQWIIDYASITDHANNTLYGQRINGKIIWTKK